MGQVVGILCVLVTYPVFAVVHSVVWVLKTPLRLSRRRYRPNISTGAAIKNAILAPLRTLGGGPFGSMDLDVLLAEAEEEVRKEGLEGELDWGPEDGWRERFGACIAATKKLSLTNIGYYAMRNNELLQPLMCRLRTNHWLKDHPEVREIEIRRPLFITGFPRTGTTFLHEMLNVDPAARAPMLWELMQPAPPVAEGEDWRSDPRVLRAVADMKDGETIAPQMGGIHDIDALLPNECYYGLARDAPVSPVALQPAGFAPHESFWRDMDMRSAYANYKTTLQTLSSTRAPASHWVLKWPSHLSHLDALLEAFPDASVVWTHRDPVKCLPSQASLYHALNGMVQTEVDAEGLGRDIMTHWADAAVRAEEVAARDPSRVLDINYEDTVKDPVRTVRRIYAHFGYEFTPAYEAALEAFLEENRKQRASIRGKLHKYGPEQFGMTAEGIDEQFREYMNKHGVPEEAKRAPGALGAV